MKVNQYQIHLSLDGSEPPVWRRLAVPCFITLDRLHEVIQIAMGWERCHLYMFKHKKNLYVQDLEDEFLMGQNEFDLNLVRLSELLKRKGSSLTYIYDFGDDWQHTIKLENSNYAFRDEDPLLVCLDGEGACPPEDSGGVWGYEDKRNRLADGTLGQDFDEEDEDLAEWLAGVPFDKEAVNLELIRFMRYSVDRALPWIDPSFWERFE